MAATVVGVLAVVMTVVTVFLRPENIDIWILHGHVEVDLILLGVRPPPVGHPDARREGPASRW